MTKNIIFGTVVALKANFAFVEIESSQVKIINNSNKSYLIRLLCTIRNRIAYEGKQIIVGDIVFLESIDLKNSQAVISGFKQRSNFLSRPALVNIQKIFVVISLKKPTFDINQLTRFLINAEEQDLEVCIVISKIDLLTLEEVNLYLNKFRSWGYEAIAISVKTNEGFNQLNNSLSSSKLSVFCGPSGVGKTSLINKLLPQVNLKVATLSKRLERGRNTTRHVELFSLANGVRIADTPGFNRPDLSLKQLELQWLFPEIRNQLKDRKCKFRNCLHKDEAGCVIDKNWERYFLYRQLLEELINRPQSFQED